MSCLIESYNTKYSIKQTQKSFLDERIKTACNLSGVCQKLIILLFVGRSKVMNEDKQGLLSVRLVKSRNYYECKKNVDELMYKFEEVRFKCHQIEPPRITPSYEIKYEKPTSMISDKIGKFIQQKIEFENEVLEFYETLTKALKTLCREELIYFKNTYYNRITEELICDLLNMSRDSLRRVKESCIVKIAMYFDIDVPATN